MTLFHLFILGGLLLGCMACGTDPGERKALVPDYAVKIRAEAQLLAHHAKEVVVHRGANHLAPENTYAAAVRAIELGVDYVEIDVHRSWDGVYYIIHDLMLGRTTNGWGAVPLRTAAYLEGLDAGSWFSEKYAGEPIPRLEEYLRWINGKAKVFLDVKTGDLTEIIALIRSLHMEDKVFFWFWNDSMARKLRRLAPEMGLKINAATPEAVQEAKKHYDATIIECDVSQINPELRRACRELGIRIMAYASSNSWEEYEAMIRSEADLVNIDRPERYLRVLDSLRQIGQPLLQ